jgi:L-arabinonolactonase
VVDISLLIDGQNNLGEGPLRDAAERKLNWIDSLDRFRIDADGRNLKKWPVPCDMALRANDGAVPALHNGFHTFDFKAGKATLIHDPEPGMDDNRINDGKVHRRGRFLAGSMLRPESEGRGSLCLDPSSPATSSKTATLLRTRRLFSPDGRSLYFADSPRRVIYTHDYDLDSCSASNKRVFASTVHDPGATDGGSADSEAMSGALRSFRAVSCVMFRTARSKRRGEPDDGQ